MKIRNKRWTLAMKSKRNNAFNPKSIFVFENMFQKWRCLVTERFCFIYKFILPTNSANSLPLIVENRIRPMAAPNFDRSFSPSFKSDFSSTPIDDFAQRMVWIQFLGLYFSLGSANWREMGYTGYRVILLHKYAENVCRRRLSRALERLKVWNLRKTDQRL